MSAYRAIVVQNIGDNDFPYKYAGTDENGNTIEDEFDNGLNHRVMAKAIYIHQARAGESKLSTIAYYREINLEMTITDCRIIYRCDKYDKGSQWSGGLTALALNAVERAVANKKTAGKVLLGHIRYEWIKEILYREKSGFLNDSSIRIVYVDLDKNTYVIETIFNKDTDIKFVANEILHSASKYRLTTNDEKNEKELLFLEKYSNEKIPEDPNPKEFSNIRFPYFYNAPSGKNIRPNSEMSQQK